MGGSRVPGRCRSNVSAEMPREVRLIVEAHAGRHLRDRLSVEESPSRLVDPSRHDVSVRGDPEGPGEASHEVRGRHVEDPPGLRQGQCPGETLIEELPKIGGDALVGTFDRFGDPLSEMPSEPRAHERKPGLGLERFVSIREHAMKRLDVSDDRAVLDVRFVDGPADQSLVEHVGSDVQDALAVSVAACSTSVVHHVRWKERHPRARRAAVSSLEVVADRALVDDEHGPRVVRVRRIRMVDESRVEHLVDAGHGRLPCVDPLVGTVQDAKIVQDAVRAPGLDGRDAGSIRPRPVVNELVGLVAFAFAGSVSPGPNNAVLWASGVRFGFRRTVPHVLGTALGIGTLVVGVAAGIGVLLEAVPAVELVLKLVGSAYLLYVAFLVVGSGVVGRASVSEPLGVLRAVAFQWVNPKAWIFAVASVGAFLPPEHHRLAAVALFTSVVMLIVVCSSTIWAIGGAALGRVVDDDRKRRAVSVVLAVLLVASVALLWT